MPNKKPGILEKFTDRIDSLVGIVNPRKEFERRSFRMANKMAFRGSYEGARNDRNRQPWIPRPNSADEDLLADLPTLRARSRDLDKNDPIAKGILNTLVSNVVGSGITPQSLVDAKKIGKTEGETENLREVIEEGYEDFVSYIDTAGRMNDSEMQQMIIRQIATNGEVFAIREMINDEPWRSFNLAYNIVEGDRIDTPSDKRSKKNIRSGVELGDRGQTLAYWVCKTHPGDFTYARRGPEAKEYQRIPLFSPYGQMNIHHLYFVRRPGQTRGEPLFSAVLNKFKDMAEYMDASLMAAKLAACFGIIIKTAGNPFGLGQGASGETQDNKRLETIYPGMIERIGQQEDITQVNPQQPGPQFDSFVDKIARFIGAGVDMPYEHVVRDFSKSNFSSSRAAILEARKGYRVMQEWMVRKFCQPVYVNFVEEMFLRGKIPAGDFYEKRKYYTRAHWIYPGWAYIEPEKEINASVEAVKANKSTDADECGARGKDWEAVYQQRARERALAKKLKLEDPQEETIVSVGRRGPKKDNKDNEGDDNEKDQ